MVWKGGISIDAGFGPPRYVLWCCDDICHQPDTFFKIGSGHTVNVENSENQANQFWASLPKIQIYYTTYYNYIHNLLQMPKTDRPGSQ